MKIIVVGDCRKPPLLITQEATGLMIATDDGKPTVLFQMTPDGKGWIRLTKGEDKNFDEVARQLKLI